MKAHGKWQRTIKCGCGNCQQRKNAKDTCPMENSKDAIWLWASDFSSNVELAVEKEEVESEEHSPVAEVYGRVESRVS